MIQSLALIQHVFKALATLKINFQWAPIVFYYILLLISVYYFNLENYEIIS